MSSGVLRSCVHILRQVYASFGTVLQLAKAAEAYEEAWRVRELVEAEGEVAAEAGGVRVMTVEEFQEVIVKVEGRLSDAKGAARRPQPVRSRTVPVAAGSGAEREEECDMPAEETQSAVSLVEGRR